jgi:hypothetical protein
MKITSPTVDRSYLTAARLQLQKPPLFKSRLLRVSCATWRVPSQSSTSWRAMKQRPSIGNDGVL